MSFVSDKQTDTEIHVFRKSDGIFPALFELHSLENCDNVWAPNKLV